ncbi:MAG: hypothetical protein IKO11_05985 [Lachnospiraceae bacterium]|nr:hypothetical protein [Lachnospiraceae bacterium]
MDAAKIGNALLSNIGIIEKAVIEIQDRRKKVVEVQEGVEAQGGGGGLGGAAGTMLGEIGGKVLSAVKVLPSVKRYVVQFNPSSLQIEARGPGHMNIMSFDGGKSVSPGKQRVRMYFRVQLVFDQENNFDAFLEDKMNLSPTQLGQNIARAGLQAAGKMKKDPTVRETVEAFVAAIRSPYTRKVTFAWGNMRYAGELNDVSAQYVMFNRKGQPVRANVSLAIQCFNEDPYPNSLGEWEAAYKRAFNDDENRTAGMGQKLGSVLNLG